MTRYLGAHTIDNGGIQMAVLRAGNAGMTALQLFTAIPKFYGDKSTIKPERVTRFKTALAKTNIKPANVVVHAAYVLSVATPEDDKWARASAGLTKELERSSTLGVGAVCFHPGSAGASDRSDSAKRIGKAITVALKTIDSSTRLLVENTAGAGKTMGKTAQEVKDILDAVPAALRRSCISHPNGSFPMKPSPMRTCRSLLEPSSVALSLRWKNDGGSPTTSSNSSSTAVNDCFDFLMS